MVMKVLTLYKEHNIDLILLDLEMPKLDVFDALTSKRSYKNAWPEEQALEYIEPMSI